MMFRLILIVCLVEYTNSWDLNGHWIIGMIAGNLISERTSQYMKSLFKPVPASFMVKVDFTKKDQDVPVRVASAAYWADKVLHDPNSGYGWSEDLHFAYSESPDCTSYKASRDCPNGRCIITALANYTMRAGDVTQGLRNRREAVSFLIHLVGDIHQPLHIGFKDDEGGTQVYLKSPKTTLHNVWDKNLFDWFFANHVTQKNQYPYHDVLEYMFKHHSDEIRAQSKADKLISSDDLKSYNSVLAIFESLAIETSSQLTCSHAYRHSNGAPIKSYQVLDDDYFKTRSVLVIDQFIKAGVRLAHFLDAVAHRYCKFDPEPCELPKPQAKSKTIANSSVARTSGSRFRLLEDDDSSSENDSFDESD